MNNTWFTADTHFCHANIIKYAYRPFKEIAEMNETIIQRWNERVMSGDTIYHLGDFGLAREYEMSYLLNILKRLRGNIVFIEGNHDKKTRLMKEYFYRYYYQYKEISVMGQDITLCHYPLKVWNKSHFGAWNLFGHCHGTLPDDPDALSIDVGVDCHDFYPISFDEIKVIMSKKTFKPVDHHGGDK